MKPSRAPQKGEVVKLGPPASGEVIITVDPSAAGTAFAAGTETLLPGAEIPVHKDLDRDQVLFVHKGQARASLNEQTMLVVPGAMLYVPRGAWHGLRNTGTGTLQIAWMSAPPGLEAFFRELSRLGASPSAHALQELAQRHRIELRPAGEARASPSAPASVGHRRRGRRGGRRRHGARGPARAGSSTPAVMPSSAPAEPSLAAPVAPGISSRAPSMAPAAPAASGAPHGRRRRHRRGRRSTPPAASQGRREQAGGVPAASAPAYASGSARPAAGRPRPSRGRRLRRVKGVYMGGRWVEVEGEGPVIAPGRGDAQHRKPSRGDDDEPPRIRLSVPL